MGWATSVGNSTSKPRNVSPSTTDGMSGVSNAVRNFPNMLPPLGAITHTPIVVVMIAISAASTDW